MVPSRRLASLVAGFGMFAPVLLGAGPVGAQEAPSGKFRDQTSVRLIEVPVEVTVGGDPLRDLQADQFTVLVDGKRVALTAFEQIDLGADGAATIEGGAGHERMATLPAVARRRVLFLFDLNGGSLERLADAKSAATDMLGQLTPTDLVAVGSFSASKGVELLLHYSPDRHQVREAVARIDKISPIGAQDPLKMSLGIDVGRTGPEYLDMPGSRAQANRREAKTYQILNDQADRRREQADAVTYLRQLGEIRRICESVEGRKHVLFFSEGFDEQLLTGTTDDQERMELQRAVSESREIWKVQSDEYFGSNQVASGVDQVVEALRRADCALHTVDLAGLRVGGAAEGTRPVGASGLFALADGTGGTYFENLNKMGQAVEALIERTQVAYLLAFQSPDVKPDGKFHKIKVEAQGLPKSARIHHRPGFFAPDAKRGPSGIEQVLAMGARLFDDRRPGELGMRAAAFALEDPGPDGRANVPLLVEIDAFKTESGAAPVDVLIYAFDKDGAVRDVVAQRFGWDPAAGRRGIKALVPLLLPGGRVTLRVLARDPASGSTALAVVDVDVPSRNPLRDSALLAALVPSTLDDWQPARAQRQDFPTPSEHPFVLAESFYAPAVNPRVTASSTLPVVLLGDDLKTSILLDANGRKLAELPLLAVKEERSPQGYGRFLREIQLPDALAAGAYSLTLGGHRVPFTVVAAGDPTLTLLPSWR
jgi:VWFA-related protein